MTPTYEKKRNLLNTVKQVGRVPLGPGAWALELARWALDLDVLCELTCDMDNGISHQAGRGSVSWHQADVNYCL
jgi:hypothetical protein